jgi:two-component system, NarL family, nitrate/nitrite response regulator NarL
MRYSVCLVEPSRLFRIGLAQIINEGRFEVTGEFASLDQLVQAARAERKPDLVLASLQTPLGPADPELGVLTTLCKEWPNVAVVALANDFSLGQLVAAFKAGAKSYLLKDTDPERLRESLALTVFGQSVFPGNLVPILLQSGSFERGLASAKVLSNHEQDILWHLARGQPNKQIARALNISEVSVKTGVKALFRKIGVRNRTEAALWAVRNLV